MTVQIILSDLAMTKLTAWSILTKGTEFSGLGLIERNGETFHVLDVDLLGVGSGVFTEFGAERQRALPLDPRRKLWFHRHPIGNGEPGEHNWSGTDRNTAVNEPLGAPDPRLVQWSVAIVLTPGGWVGRVDLHVPTHKVFHAPVTPRYAMQQDADAAMRWITPGVEALVDELRAEYAATQKTYRTYPLDSWSGADWENALDDEDLEFLRWCSPEERRDFMAELEISMDDLPFDLRAELEQEDEEDFANDVSDEPNFVQRAIRYFGGKRRWRF